MPIPSKVSLQGIERGDIVVWTIGQTGAGKTSLIKRAMHGTSPPAKASDHLSTSRTRSVQAVRLIVDKKSVVMVDMPGLDNTVLSNFQLLQLMSKWFQHVRKIGITVQLLLYFHRMTDVRVPYDTSMLLTKIIGTEFAQHTFVVTTMGTGSQAEIDQLNSLRGDLLLQDIEPHRFDNTPDSALMILRKVIKDVDGHAKLLLQKELVDDKLHLSQTQAGRFLFDKHSRSTILSEMDLAYTAAEEYTDAKPLLEERERKEYDQKKRLLIRQWSRLARIPLKLRLKVWIRKKYALMVHGSDIV